MQSEILQKMKSKGIAFSVPEEIIAIYLYGSSARGVLREESDIDVAILPSYKTTEEERLGLIARVEGIIDKLLRKKGIQREISILDLRGKFVSLTLQYKIVTEGILLYERDAGERSDRLRPFFLILEPLFFILEPSSFFLFALSSDVIRYALCPLLFALSL